MHLQLQLEKTEIEKHLRKLERLMRRGNHGEPKGKCRERNVRKGLSPGHTETIKTYSPINRLIST